MGATLYAIPQLWQPAGQHAVIHMPCQSFNHGVAVCMLCAGPLSTAQRGSCACRAEPAEASATACSGHQYSRYPQYSKQLPPGTFKGEP